MERTTEEPAELVTALARGLHTLEAFTADSVTMTLTEVAAATGTTPATARRSLITLEHLGYVQQVGRQFRLTPKVLSLGGAYFDALSLAGLARPILHRLAASIDRACSLTVLDGHDVVYLAHAPAAAGPSLRRHYVGARLPAHATSTGHVLLAALPSDALDAFLSSAPFTRYTRNTPTASDRLADIFERVSAQGYAVVSDTVEYGTGAIAVPVRDGAGEVVAALNVTLSTVSDRGIDEALDLVDALRSAADELTTALVRFPHAQHTA